MIKIPFSKKHIAILGGPPKSGEFNCDSIDSFLDSLDKVYKDGVWTPSIKEITNDIRYVLRRVDNEK